MAVTESRTKFGLFWSPLKDNKFLPRSSWIFCSGVSKLDFFWAYKKKSQCVKLDDLGGFSFLWLTLITISKYLFQTIVDFPQTMGWCTILNPPTFNAFTVAFSANAASSPTTKFVRNRGFAHWRFTFLIKSPSVSSWRTYIW